MNSVDWDQFESERDALNYLKSLPRYNNNPFKSLFWRANFFLHLVFCRLFKINKPLFIVFVTNNKCNLDCTYCYGEYGKKDHYEEYSTTDLCKMIDELKEMGTKLLTMHGGESLLRPDLGEILNYSKLKGFYVSFNTNGYAVPQRIEEIRCADTVCISLDGREENNDKNRGEGCFKKAIAAIDVLTASGVPVVLSATLTKEVLDDMEYLAKLAVSKGVRIQYSILYNHSDQSQQEIVMSSEEVRRITKKIWDLKKAGYPVYYAENVLSTTFHWPLNFDRRFLLDTDEDFDDVVENNQVMPCYHGSLKFQMDADGRVVVCWAQNDPNAPNVKDIGIKEAFKQVEENNNCRYCVYLANNEHNGLMQLSPRNIWRSIIIQISDAFKIKKSVPQSCGNNAKKAEADLFDNGNGHGNGHGNGQGVAPNFKEKPISEKSVVS